MCPADGDARPSRSASPTPGWDRNAVRISAPPRAAARADNTLRSKPRVRDTYRPSCRPEGRPIRVRPRRRAPPASHGRPRTAQWNVFASSCAWRPTDQPGNASVPVRNAIGLLKLHSVVMMRTPGMQPESRRRAQTADFSLPSGAPLSGFGHHSAPNLPRAVNQQAQTINRAQHAPRAAVGGACELQTTAARALHAHDVHC